MDSLLSNQSAVIENFRKKPATFQSIEKPSINYQNNQNNLRTEQKINRHYTSFAKYD